MTNKEERNIIRNKVTEMGYSIDGDDYNIIPDDVQSLMVLLNLPMNDAIIQALGGE